MPGVLDNGEVNLFFKLLDSLNESLKTLATKYELLTKELDRQDKLATSIEIMTTKIMPFLIDISKGIEEMRHVAPELKIERANQIATLQALLDNCNNLERTMTRVIDDMRIHKDVSVNAKNSIDHIDEQVDGSAITLGSIKTKMDDLSKLPDKVDALRKEMEPTQKMVEMFRKPLAIVLIIYGLIATVISVAATAKWAGERFDKKAQSTSSASNTNTSSNKNGP